MTPSEKILSRVKKAIHTLEGIPALVQEQDWDEVEFYLDEVDLQLSQAEDLTLTLQEQHQPEQEDNDA